MYPCLETVSAHSGFYFKSKAVDDFQPREGNLRQLFFSDEIQSADFNFRILIL